MKNTEYLRTWERSERAFGIDVMVWTNLLAAESIVRVVGIPAARDVDSFADGRVQMAEFEIPSGSPVTGQTVAEADRFDDLTLAAILRDGEVLHAFSVLYLVAFFVASVLIFLDAGRTGLTLSILEAMSAAPPPSETWVPGPASSARWAATSTSRRSRNCSRSD